MRHCDKNCGLFKYVPYKDECPILDLKQKRKDSEWWIEVDGKEIYPLCEDKIVRVAKKKRRMLTI